MKNLSCKAVFVSMIFLGWSCVYGKEMPPEIAKAATVAEVRLYLESPNEVTRIAAVRRLGQLSDQNAVDLLAEQFAKELYEAAIDTTPYVKIEIIEALGQIGGEAAEKSLLDIFDSYWQKGPEAKIYVWEDSDYMKILPATLEALYKWRNEKKIIDLFENVYSHERKIPDWHTRQKAYELYLRAEIERKNIASPEKIVEYLSPMLTSRGSGHIDDWVKGKNGVKTLKAIKNGAIVEILTKCGEPVLPSIDKELSKISAANEKRRYETFSYIRECISKTMEYNQKEREKINEPNDTNTIPTK